MLKSKKCSDQDICLAMYQMLCSTFEKYFFSKVVVLLSLSTNSVKFPVSCNTYYLSFFSAILFYFIQCNFGLYFSDG